MDRKRFLRTAAALALGAKVTAELVPDPRPIPLVYGPRSFEGIRIHRGNVPARFEHSEDAFRYAIPAGRYEVHELVLDGGGRPPLPVSA